MQESFWWSQSYAGVILVESVLMQESFWWSQSYAGVILTTRMTSACIKTGSRESRFDVLINYEGQSRKTRLTKPLVRVSRFCLAVRR